MFQRDYILKMIEMLGELVAGILGLIKKGEFSKAGQALDNAYYDLLKQDASYFKNLPTDQLTHHLLQEHNYTHGHLEILAELFLTQAKLFESQNKMEHSLIYYGKALIIFQFIDKEAKVFSFEQQAKIDSLKEKIKQLTN